MEGIEVKCPNCKQIYLAQKFNTRFTGPYMSSECSKCGKTYNGKFLTFLIKQHYTRQQDEIDRFKCCIDMIEMAKGMDSKLNPEPLKGKAEK
jgi:transposase-like protein